MHLRTPAVALSAALALGLAACGSDDDQSSSSTAAAAPAAAKPIVAVDQLKGESTAIFLSPGFAGSLGELKAQGAPLGGTKISATGRTTYPISGGALKYFEPGTETPALQGVIEHEGSGLRLFSGSKKLDLRNFRIDVDKLSLSGDVTVDGKADAEDTPLFSLDASKLAPTLDDETGVALLKGFTVKLEAGAAELINSTFGVEGVKADQVVGSATVTVATK